MPKYVKYDPKIEEEQRVFEFFDTDFAHYPDLPDENLLLELTEEQWNARIQGKLHVWSVTKGVFHEHKDTSEEIYQQSVADYRRELNYKLGASQNLLHLVHEAVLMGEFEVNGPEAQAVVKYRRALKAELALEQPDISKPLPEEPKIKF